MNLTGLTRLCYEYLNYKFISKIHFESNGASITRLRVPGSGLRSHLESPVSVNGSKVTVPSEKKVYLIFPSTSIFIFVIFFFRSTILTRLSYILLILNFFYIIHLTMFTIHLCNTCLFKQFLYIIFNKCKKCEYW